MFAFAATGILDSHSLINIYLYEFKLQYRGELHKYSVEIMNCTVLFSIVDSNWSNCILDKLLIISITTSSCITLWLTLFSSWVTDVNLKILLTNIRHTLASGPRMDYDFYLAMNVDFSSSIIVELE